jgi:hypothetical protein
MRFLAPPHQWFLKLTFIKTELWVYYSEDECEYDDKQCDYYYQDYIEDKNREIRKKLHKNSQPRMAFILTGSKRTENEEMREATS